MKAELCQQYVARDKKVIAPCQHLSYFPLVVAKGEGSIITDLDGNRYIDFLSSASSLNLGSCEPTVTRALQSQINEFSQYTAIYSYCRQNIEYAERLVSVYPGGVPAKVCWGNCGSDANDAAVKFARAWTRRQNIIVFLNAYHGTTYGSASLSTCTVNMQAKMGPMLPGVHVFPFCGTDKTDEEAERGTQPIEEAFTKWLAPDEVAAVIIEPVQGDGGILPAHPIFMKKLYELCREHGILFISEEVQMGFYRTGKFFGIEHYGIIPDGIIMGKSVGAGLPLGAFMGRAEIMDSLGAPAHLFTLGGCAAACAAGCAAFDVYQSEEFQAQLRSNIARLRELADWLKRRHPDVVGFVRTIGMSAGIGITKGGVADRDGTFKILYRSYENGLIMISLAGNVLRIQPPLNIEPELLQKGFEIIDAAMDDYQAGKIPDDVLTNRAGW